MKTNRLLITGLFAAAAVLFASCGDRDSNAQSDDNGSKSSESAKPYPLTTCVVSGEELGSMGEPYVIVHEGTEVRFCCKECLPKFEADPEKYLSELAAQTAN